MNNTKDNYTHPEAFFEVFAEFQRLHARQPDVDGTILWALARDLAWTLALAETSLFKQEHGIS